MNSPYVPVSLPAKDSAKMRKGFTPCQRLRKGFAPSFLPSHPVVRFRKGFSPCERYSRDFTPCRMVNLMCRICRQFVHKHGNIRHICGIFSGIVRNLLTVSHHEFTLRPCFLPCERFGKDAERFCTFVFTFTPCREIPQRFRTLQKIRQRCGMLFHPVKGAPEISHPVSGERRNGSRETTLFSGCSECCTSGQASAILLAALLRT